MAKHGTVKDKSWGGLGGNNPMHPWQGVGEQEPGQSASGGSGGKRDMGPDTGSKHGFYSDNEKKGREMSTKAGSNTDYAGTHVAGTSGPTKAGGDRSGFAKGGTTSMHGNRGSVPQQGGRSSQQ